MTTSARPEHLEQFVQRCAPMRQHATDTHRGVAILAGQVRRNSIDVDVDLPSIVALSTVWATIETTDAFVAAVGDALLAADGGDVGGVVTIGDQAVATALTEAGATPDPIEFEPATMVGLPITSGFVDDPICAATGNMIHQDLDLEHPGRSAVLELTRTYNSVVGDRAGSFGPGWSTVLDCFVAASPERIEVRLPDGATAAWVHTPTGWGASGRRVHEIVDTDSGWDVATDHQHLLRFDGDGRLTGWVAGTAEVDVARTADRVVALTERRSGRSVRLDWRDGRVVGVATGDGRAVEFRYDAEGRLVAAAGPDRASVSYEWHDGLLRSVADADGVRLFENDYDEHGRVVRQVSPFGRATRYRYDGRGMTVITDDAHTRQAMVHDRRGNLTAVIDADGSAMRIAYDHADRMVEVVDRDGATWRYEYDPVSGALAARTDPDGLGATWSWDAVGRVRSHTDRAGSTTFYEYPEAVGPAGRPLVTPCRVVDALGEELDIVVDVELDQPRSLTDADGVTVDLVHDADGQPVAVVDALGACTELDRDAAGRLVRLVDPCGTATVIEYDAAGRSIAAERGGAVLAVSRTAAGRVVGVREPGGGDLAGLIEFGPHGAPVAITDADGATIRFQHDPMGNVVAVVAADGATFHQFFDDVGRLVGTADPTGATTHLTYDRAGRVVELVDPDGRRWRRDVDQLGRTTAVHDPTGATTTWTYHPGGQVATATSPTGETWSTEVDHRGRTIALVDLEGRRTEFVFSAAGRLVAKRFHDGSVETLEYDAAGRLAASVDPAGVRRTIDRDPAGRIVAAHRHDTSTSPPAAVFDRDELGRVVGIRTPVGSESFELDVAGRLVSHVDGTGVRRGFEWNARGLLATATDPAGGVLAYEHDARGRLVAQMAPGDRLTTFGHDPAGRLASMTDAAGVHTAFGYDLAGHLTGQRRGDIGWRTTLDAAGRPEARHDLAGELLDRVAAATGATVATRADQAGSPGLRAARLDEAGRVTVTTDGTTYRYDEAGRLAQVRRPDGDVIRYGYDEHGLLAVERSERGTRRFRYDAGGRVAAITDGTGTIRYEYDDAGRRSAEVRPDGTRCEFAWTAHDRLVGITSVTADGERRAVSIEHGAPGRPVRVDDVTVGPLTFLGARVHDAVTGQFLTPDPLLPQPGSNGSASPYTYAWLDPINHVDPTGMRPIGLAEWETIRAREEQGLVGAAVDAVPWDVVAAVGVVAVGVGLMFVPGGQLIGGGILIGATSSTVVGLAMGDLDPLDIALGGVLGGGGGGIGVLAKGGLTVGRVAIANGALSVAGDAVGAHLDGTSYGVADGVRSFTLGGATARLGSFYDDVGALAHPIRRAGADAATDAGASAVDQYVGTGTVDYRAVLAQAGGGVPGGLAGAWVDRSDVSNRIDRTLPIAQGADPSGPGIPVYRPVSAVELEVFGDTGLVLSERAMTAYEHPTSVLDATRASVDAHADAVAAWGDERMYAAAIDEFGAEVSAVSGDSTLIEMTTDPSAASAAAGPGGIVLTATVPSSALIGGDGDTVFTRHAVEMSEAPAIDG